MFSVPVIGPEDEVVVFIHGHSSRLEEAGSLYAALAAERASCSPHRLVLVAFDLPTHGYSAYIDHQTISPLHETRFVPDHPEDRRFGILEFFESLVVAFVEALDGGFRVAGRPGILHRISAVIGGSLGGNLAFRLAERLVTNPSWLRAVVAWSPGSAPPSLGRADYLIPSPGEHVDPIAKQALDRTRDRCDDGERTDSRSDYFRILLGGERLIKDGTPGFEAVTRFLGHLVGPLVEGFIPLGPFAIFGSSVVVEGVANVAVFKQSDQWLRPECRGGLDAAARATAALLSLTETYSSARRRMHWRVAFEQLIFSHQDQIAVSRGRACYELSAVPLLLIAGANDNTDRWEIYNSVRGFAPRMRTNPGRVLFVQNTGHSIHDERPRWLARRIQQFLCEQRTRVPVRDRLLVALDVGGTAGNDFWVMDYHRPTRRWAHLSPIPGLSADLNCDEGLPMPTAFGVRFAVAGDFDGDGQNELAVAPDAAGTGSNDFWVMKYNRWSRTWGHLSPIPGHNFGADLDCGAGLVSPTAVGVKFALAGDFDGDAQDELVVAPNLPGTGGNDFWVMKFDRMARRWGHLVKGIADGEVARDIRGADPIANGQLSRDELDKAERRGDYWVFGGIFRPVWLEAAPPQSIAHAAIDARADGSLSATVRLAERGLLREDERVGDDASERAVRCRQLIEHCLPVAQWAGLVGAAGDLGGPVVGDDRDVIELFGSSMQLPALFIALAMVSPR